MKCDNCPLKKKEIEALASALKGRFGELYKMTAEDLWKWNVPTPQNEIELFEIIRILAERKHDYVTTILAMSIASVAAKRYIGHVLGATGFQAGEADLDYIRRERHLKKFLIIDIEKLLYPQFWNEEHFPSKETLLKQNLKWLKRKIRENMKESQSVAPHVKAHWEWILSLGDDG